jgi:sugar phosphate isomerase/epimerase
MSKPVIGAQLFTLRDFEKTLPDFAESMKKVAAIGYKTVQVSGLGPIDAKDIVNVTDGEGLEIATTHMGWPRFLDELDAVIEEHKTFKCKHPAIGGLPGEYFSADGLKKFIDELGPVSEKLAAEGMDFSYHNHAHEMAKFDGRTWLGALYEDTSSDILKAELDTHWIAAGGGDPAQWIAKVAGRMPILHLKDFVIGDDSERRFAEIGEGNMNWKAIFAAAEAADVEYMMVEQDDCYGRDPFKSLAISYNNLKGMGYE